MAILEPIIEDEEQPSLLGKPVNVEIPPEFKGGMGVRVVPDKAEVSSSLLGVSPEDDVADERTPLHRPVTLRNIETSSAPVLEPIEDPELDDRSVLKKATDKFISSNVSPVISLASKPAGRQILLQGALGLSEDEQRDVIASTVNQVENLKRTLDYLQHRNALPENEQKALDESIKKASAETYRDLTESIGLAANLQEPLFDIETGRLIASRTALTDAIATMAPPIAAGMAIGGLPGLIVGAAAYAILSPPEDNLTNALKDIGFEEGSEGMNLLLHTITTENLSEESRDRSTQLLEEVIFIAAAPGVKGAIGVTKKAVKGINQHVMPHLAPLLDDLKKPYELLTESEKATVVFNALRSTGLQVRSQAGGRKVEATVEGVFSAIKNTYAAANRIVRHTFTASGLAPKSIRNVGERAKQNVAAATMRAANLTTKLDTLIEEIAGKADGSQLKVREAIQSALTKGFDLIPPTGTIDISDIKKLLRKNEAYDILSDDVLDIVIEMRGTIDDLSYNLTSSLSFAPNSKPAKDLLETLYKNVGTYLNTSYRIHGDGWKVEKHLYAETVTYFAAKFMQRNSKLSSKLAQQKATDFVNDVLKGTKADPYKSSSSQLDFDLLNRRNTGILKLKDLEDPQLKKLYGEILDPSENYLTTISKLSQLVEQSKYHDDIFKQGVNSKYPFIFSADDLRQSDIYSYKIKGTNSILDGMYTTPEIGIVLQNKQAALTPLIGVLLTTRAIEQGGPLTVIGANAAAINLASIKAVTQKMKTVWSLTTHSRNGIGAGLMTFAQGHNPFNKESYRAFKAISGRTDEESLAFRIRLTELGVTNSSPRLGEYKELLTEYRRIMDSGVDADVAAEQFYAFTQKISSKIGIRKVNIDNIDNILTKVYQATDDLFKASLFIKERQVLKKAWPTLSDEALDRDAAELVKNLLPNYNRITPGARSLRNIPFIGSFIGFSAELIRVGGRTLTQSAKEMASGNPVLMKRGAVRLAAFTVMAGAASKAAETYSAKAVGFTEKQLEALKTFYKTEYGEQTYMFLANVDGTIDRLNLTFTDPWTMLSQPWAEAARARAEGKITTEEEEQIRTDSALAFLKAMARPFVSETVFNQAISEAVTSLQTGKRLKSSGFITDISGENVGERLPDVMVNFFVDIGPHIIKEAGEFKDIVIDEEAVGTYAEPKDKEDYLSKRITTLARSPVQILSEVKSKINNYNFKANDLRSPSNIRQANTYESFVDKYKDANTALVEEASDLYLKFKAVEDFYGETSESRELARSTLRRYTSKDSNILLISRGTAPQIDVSYETVWTQTRSLRAEGKVPNTATEFHPWFKKFKTDIALPYGETDLNKQEVDPADQIVLDPVRMNKAEGGVLEDPSMYRADGSKKSAVGFLGPHKNLVSGGTMTEVSVGLEINGEEIEVPAMVPTLTKKEIDTLTNMEIEGNARNIPSSITNKARRHALKRIEEGKSVFYVDGEERLGKDKGGEVDVPNASPEPDERIDKMTGLPYNLQAGIAFRDEEDPLKRLGLVGGGKAVDPMQRLGFAKGKLVVDALKKGEEVIELGAEQVSSAFKYLIDATGVDKVTKGKGKVPVVKESGGRHLEIGSSRLQRAKEQGFDTATQDSKTRFYDYLETLTPELAKKMQIIGLDTADTKLALKEIAEFDDEAYFEVALSMVEDLT